MCQREEDEEKKRNSCAVRRMWLKWHRKEWVVLSKGLKKKCQGKVNSSNVCSIHRRLGRGERVLWLQCGHYWLFLCSVKLVEASVGVSPRAALERTSTHLAWSSASWALKSKVCWVWLSRKTFLTSGLSAAPDGTTLTSNPGRGTARDPLESCRKLKPKPTCFFRERTVI